MEVSLIPIREIFYNCENNYRILSCIQDYNSKSLNTKIELNNFGNFTISGYNLSEFEIGSPINLNIELDTNSKYPASYIVTGYAGISTDNNNIKVDPAYELLLLKQIMTEAQAQHINEVYPNFIELVLNNKESEIDFHKIYNVAEYRMNDYCEKIKNKMKVFLFFSTAKKYNITNFDIISKFSNVFITPEDFEKNYLKNPYELLSKLTDWKFNKIDKTILSALPNFESSIERTIYCIISILKENELDGDTRLSGFILKNIIEEEYPELLKFLPTAISMEKLFFYDSITKDCSLRDTYNNELLIANNIKYRVNNPFKDSMQWQNFKNVDNYIMTSEQIKLCEFANDFSISMLVGAGGTGKSTSTRALIKMLDFYNKTYLLLAPTGISSKKLRESTERNAMTIHMALATNMFENEFDYIIIDEMSCVGVSLLASVFEKIKKETKIIFICDASQLASISCGNIVQDIIDSNIVPTIELTKVFRYGTSGIATIATNTRHGSIDGRESYFDDNDYKFINIDESNAINQIIKEYNILLEKYNKDDILILCPFNKSNLGSYVINEAIQNNFNHNKKSISFPIKIKNCPVKQITFKIGDRVLNTNNNYKVPVAVFENNNYTLDFLNKTTAIMNGDIGTIVDIQVDELNKNTYLFIQFDNDLVRFNKKEIASLMLGYCISIHKSQGAQAKAIISVIGKNHKRMITRNLIYVAVSRAEKNLVEIVNKDCVSEGLKIQETITRATWLKDLLIEK